MNRILIGAALAAAGALIAPAHARAQNACASINGTYVAAALGKFDSFKDTLAFAWMTYSAGAGEGRQLISYTADQPGGVHVKLKAKCTSLDATTARMTFTSQIPGNVWSDAGWVDYYIYDGGARIWAQSWDKARPLSGWLYRQAPAPRVTKKG